MTLVWPDIVIGGIALLFALKGWKRGFVSELGGAVALFLAIVAAFYYPGNLDDFAEAISHTGTGSAHVIGLVLFCVIVYVLTMGLAWLLGRVAKLPVITWGNSALGAVVGICKGLVGAWVVLYLILFFPLASDVRHDLHESTLVQIVTQPNERLDGVLRGTMPWFVKPFVGPIFDRHRA
jgi:uncharacterized membrane protein required for colicin V production